MITFAFDDKNEDAQKAALDAGAKMVSEISDETEQAIRNVIAQSIRDGVPPYEAAKNILPLIGLTRAQAQAVQKYRAQLASNGLTPKQVDDKSEQYADELLDLRADTIARSEIMDALNNGQEEAWLQAQEDGVLSEDATKEWITTPDELTCPQCEPMDGKTAPIGDEFEEGDPPLHPNCRCTIGISKP